MSHTSVKIGRALPTGNNLFNERGQSIVIITLLFVGVVAMLGLVIDGGNAYLQRRRAQNAADSAAFAGAIELARGTLVGESMPQTDARILNKINSFAVSNGITNPSSNLVPYYIDASGDPLTLVGLGNVPGNAKGVVVTPTLPFNTFFLGVVGETAGAVKATAKASFAPILSPDSIQPLGRKCIDSTLAACGFQYGQPYDIWDADTPGNFGWLCWRNTSCNAGYTADELNPNGGTMAGYEDPHDVCPDGHIAASNNEVPCWVNGNTGVSNSSAIRGWLDYWIAKGAQNPPVPMVTVIWDQSEGTGSNSNFRIKGFAAFILQSYNLPGGDVIGTFVKWVGPGDLCTGSCNNYGLNGVHLRP